MCFLAAAVPAAFGWLWAKKRNNRIVSAGERRLRFGPTIALSYTDDVLLFLHTLSAVAFYALGLSLFLAYIMLRNAIGGDLPLGWLRIMDLPMLLIGLLYGGISLYQSFRNDRSISTILLCAIAIPLLCIFIGFAILNFLPVTP